MPTLEWINTQQNLPHQFSTSAEQALQMSKILVQPVKYVDGVAVADTEMARRYPTPAWNVWKIDGQLGGGAPVIPLVKNPATGQWDYIPIGQWTIDNIQLGNRTLNQIFNPSTALPIDQGPGVATPWVGGPNDPQIYIPPVVPVITGGGTPVDPTVPTVQWWMDLIDRVDAAATNGNLTAAGLADAVQRLTAIPQPRPSLVESKLNDWNYILSNHLLEAGGGFAPVRVVVEGRGRMVYNQFDLNAALAAGGYIDPGDGGTGPQPTPTPGLQLPSSSPSLLTWGLIAAGAFFVLRKK